MVGTTTCASCPYSPHPLPLLLLSRPVRTCSLVVWRPLCVIFGTHLLFFHALLRSIYCFIHGASLGTLHSISTTCSSPNPAASAAALVLHEMLPHSVVVALTHALHSYLPPAVHHTAGTSAPAEDTQKRRAQRRLGSSNTKPTQRQRGGLKVL